MEVLGAPRVYAWGHRASTIARRRPLLDAAKGLVVSGFGLRVCALGFGGLGLGCLCVVLIQESGIQGFGFRVSGLGFRVESLGFGVWGLGFGV